MYIRFKALLDFLSALLILAIVSPILLVLTIVLFIQNNGHPFFQQKRPGYQERPFYLTKFKSMTDERDANGQFLPD
ncbi:MAG: sugar transferase, partial [Flavobacteriales bacterium]|nr:sugar transferase [Flavobacteriales bacterium]